MVDPPKNKSSGRNHQPLLWVSFEHWELRGLPENKFMKWKETKKWKNHFLPKSGGPRERRWRSCIMMLFCIHNAYLLLTPHYYVHIGTNICGEIANSELAIANSNRGIKLLFQEICWKILFWNAENNCHILLLISCDILHACDLLKTMSGHLILSLRFQKIHVADISM